MSAADQIRFDVPEGLGLRSELSVRNLRYAAAYGLLHERTDGHVPSIIFGLDEAGKHGNFHHAAYKAIAGNPAWLKRLDKVHTAYKRSRVRADWEWKELDCASSSDALLMNIFCHPDVMLADNVRAMLGVETGAAPEFGFKPRTSLKRGGRDNTEIDMRIGNLLVEAKLTESDFQSARFELVSRYRDFETVFCLEALPMRQGKHACYQLIRGTLAAYALECSFCVLCDARRPDLLEAWYSVMRAVQPFDLRCRLKLLTWQELASGLPEEMRDFLALKYGIFAAF